MNIKVVVILLVETTFVLGRFLLNAWLLSPTEWRCNLYQLGSFRGLLFRVIVSAYEMGLMVQGDAHSDKTYSNRRIL